MSTNRKIPSHLLAVTLILLFALCVSSLPVRRSHHQLHSLQRRSHPPPKPPILHEDDETILLDLEGRKARAELSHHGVKKLIVEDDDDDEIVEEDILEEDLDDDYPGSIMRFEEEEEEQELKQSKPFREEIPKKFVPMSEKKIRKEEKPQKERFPEEMIDFTEDYDEGNTESTTKDTDIKQTTPVTEPSVTSFHWSTKRKSPDGHYDPLVLPVTTEGKTNTKQKLEEPLKVYGFPKELLPIMPGGGSRFEDVEREKLEKKKMSQTKGGDDDSAESGGSHEAEGLYSSASLSSISLVFYCFVSFLFLDRISL